MAIRPSGRPRIARPIGERDRGERGPTRPPPPPVIHALELFAALGPIRTRAMFGGWGFYCDEAFFALIADDILYLKADAESESAFRDAGSSPFTYAGRAGRTVTLSYWSAPDSALESASEMRDWARLALGAAIRAQRLRRPAR